MFDLPLDLAIIQLRNKINEISDAADRTVNNAMINFACPDYTAAQIALIRYANGSMRAEVNQKQSIAHALLEIDENTNAPTRLELFLQEGETLGRKYKQQLETLQVLNQRLHDLENRFSGNDSEKENLPRWANESYK